MRILVEAFACQPGAGSEAGYGWHYPVEFARRGHDVTVVTTERWRDDIETAVAELSRSGAPAPRFVFVSRRRWPLELGLGWTVGSAMQYILWLWEAASEAHRLHCERPFDVLHHATYGSLLGGSFLWRIVGKDGGGRDRTNTSRGHGGAVRRGPALVLGPLGGGQTAPPAFAEVFGDGWRDEVLRSVVVRRLWPLSWYAVLAARRSSAVLCTNRETGWLARRMGAPRVERVTDVAVPTGFGATARLRDDAALRQVRVLWLGRIMPRKGLRLAVMAVERVPGVRLEIVGGGVNEQVEADFRAWLKTRPARDRVTMTGPVLFAEVGAAYERADIFVFPSLRESTGNQLLEAMAYGLPVVCLDHQGARELVDDAVGVRVPVTDVEGTVDGLARAIAELAADPERRMALGKAARRAAGAYTWDVKAETLLRLFADVARVEASAQAGGRPAEGRVS